MEERTTNTALHMLSGYLTTTGKRRRLIQYQMIPMDQDLKALSIQVGDIACVIKGTVWTYYVSFLEALSDI